MNLVPNLKNLMFRFFARDWHSPVQETTRAYGESSVGCRSGQAFPGRGLQGDGVVYIDLSAIVTGTLTAEVDWKKDNLGVVNPLSTTFFDYIGKNYVVSAPSSGNISLTTEVDNTAKTITFQNGHRYFGLHVYENGVRIGYYELEEFGDLTTYNVISNDNHLTFEATAANFWVEDSDIPFSFANTTGYNTFYNLVSFSEQGWNINGTPTVGRREVFGFSEVLAQPDDFGTNFAVEFTEDNSDPNPRLSASNDRPTLQTGETYTYSVWMKTTASLSPLNVRLSLSGGSSASSIFVNITDTWARYWVTFTMNITDARNGIVGGFGSIPQGGIPSQVIIISHPQLVAGDDPLPFQATGALVGQSGNNGTIPASLHSKNEDALGNSLLFCGPVRQQYNIVDNNCLFSDATWQLQLDYEPTLIELNGDDITGDCTIVNNAPNWEVTFPASTDVYNLRINSTYHYPCSEGLTAGSTIGGFQNVTTPVTASLLNFTPATHWGKQDVYAWNAINGASSSLTPSLNPDIFGLKNNRLFPKQVESKLQFNDSPMIIAAGLDPTVKYDNAALQAIFNSSNLLFGDNNNPDYMAEVLGYIDTTNEIDAIEAYTKS